jgi:hypothetical protein
MTFRRGQREAWSNYDDVVMWHLRREHHTDWYNQRIDDWGLGHSIPYRHRLDDDWLYVYDGSSYDDVDTAFDNESDDALDSLVAMHLWAFYGWIDSDGNPPWRHRNPGCDPILLELE